MVIKLCPYGLASSGAYIDVVDDRVVEGEGAERSEKGGVLRVGLICGGLSAECGISLNSARSVLDHIQ
ncbi:unnamed protein product [Ilex paraguariensis]|uniref:Uncharacterized protein n=1 Tax=Ilex paraguariensis TaxID=185542 RepID=A0ABC8UT62_9AQUA